jgi:hypothetical protein
VHFSFVLIVCWYSGKTPHPGLSQIKASFDRTGWTPAQHELFQRSEMVKLHNMWGDQTASRLVMARQFIRELEFRSPGVVGLLERTGLGNNSRIVAMVVAQAERRLAYRNGNTK